ncbi:MAG TPA: FxLYD domain-containing protein [Nitrososphaeraceae archaeon]
MSSTKINEHLTLKPRILAIYAMLGTRFMRQSYAPQSKFLMSIFLCSLTAALGLILSSMYMNPTHAQVEIPTNENYSNPIFNGTKSEDSRPNPAIIYSALKSDTIVGEVKNNFTYPIELVRITASVHDKNGLLVATGDTYTSDYQIKPGSKSGFDIYLDEKLPSNSKYILTSSFNQSEKVKPEALQLSVGRNSKDSNSYKVLGEVMNQGKVDANSVKVSGIFYDDKHKVVNVDYEYTNPDIIGPNKKAPFELSFYTNNPEKIKSVAINAQSDEYSLITNYNQNKTKSGP